MKPRSNLTVKRTLLLLALVMMTAVAAPQAFAAVTDTDAGDTISNTATVNYSVASVAQTPVNSNTVDFVVDHKVRPLADNPVGANATPGSSASYLTFTVTNDGNTNTTIPADVLEIQLNAQADPGNPFAVTNILIYVEDNGTAGLQTGGGGDTLVSDIAAASLGTIDLARDTTATVYVLATMAAGATDGQTASVHLVATAWDTALPGALAEDADGDDPNAEEVVYADDAGTVPAPIGPDAAFDGRDSEVAVFTIVTASIGVVKSSTVVTDPFGSAYRVPGARVQYVIDITNTGSSAADNVVIVDTIPANTHFYVGSVVGGAAAYSNDNQTSWVYVPVAGGDGGDPAVTDVQVTLAGSIAGGGGTAQVTFEVLID